MSFLALEKGLKIVCIRFSRFQQDLF